MKTRNGQEEAKLKIQKTQDNNCTKVMRFISNDMLKYEIEPQSRTNKKSGKKMQPFNIKKKKESLEEWNQT